MSRPVPGHPEEKGRRATGGSRPSLPSPTPHLTPARPGPMHLSLPRNRKQEGLWQAKGGLLSGWGQERVTWRTAILTQGFNCPPGVWKVGDGGGKLERHPDRKSIAGPAGVGEEPAGAQPSLRPEPAVLRTQAPGHPPPHLRGQLHCPGPQAGCSVGKEGRKEMKPSKATVQDRRRGPAVSCPALGQIPGPQKHPGSTYYVQGCGAAKLVSTGKQAWWMTA